MIGATMTQVSEKIIPRTRRAGNFSHSDGSLAKLEESFKCQR